jgi:hypothetical protein
MSESWGWDEHSLMAVANCPVPDCGAFAISYKSFECIDGATCTHLLGWEFACPRCGAEFVPPRDELMFQSVPKGWLLANISHA